MVEFILTVIMLGFIWVVLWSLSEIVKATARDPLMVILMIFGLGFLFGDDDCDV